MKLLHCLVEACVNQPQAGAFRAAGLEVDLHCRGAGRDRYGRVLPSPREDDSSVADDLDVATRAVLSIEQLEAKPTMRPRVEGRRDAQPTDDLGGVGQKLPHHPDRSVNLNLEDDPLPHGWSVAVRCCCSAASFSVTIGPTQKSSRHAFAAGRG